MGKLTDALETAEAARGHRFAFHRPTGSADLAPAEAVRLSARAGRRHRNEAGVERRRRAHGRPGHEGHVG
jgi:hypothetical protein